MFSTKDPVKDWTQGPLGSPSTSFDKHHNHQAKVLNSHAPEPINFIHPPTYSQQGLDFFTSRASTK